MHRWFMALIVCLAAAPLAHGAVYSARVPVFPDDWRNARWTDDGGVVGTGPWGTDGYGFRIAWEVVFDPTPGLTHPFFYRYTLTTNNPVGNGFGLLGDGPPAQAQEISRWTASISSIAGAGDFLDLSWDADRVTIGPVDSNSPGPKQLGQSITFDGVDGAVSVFSFYSNKAPAWGDFYANSGRLAEVYNEGLFLELPDEGTFDTTQYILVPGTDTIDTVDSGHLPEPASVVVWSVLAAGGAALAWHRRRTTIMVRGHWPPEARRAILDIVGANRRRIP